MYKLLADFGDLLIVSDNGNIPHSKSLIQNLHLVDVKKYDREGRKGASCRPWMLENE